jgi:hypothetical protein
MRDAVRQHRTDHGVERRALCDREVDRRDALPAVPFEPEIGEQVLEAADQRRAVSDQRVGRERRRRCHRAGDGEHLTPDLERVSG